jgi:hypothetical protein
MSEPFNGSWSINLDESRVRDADNQKWVSPDPIGREDVTMFIDGDIYDQTISVGLNPTFHMGYTAQWDGDWVPYMCRSIEYPEIPSEHPGHPRMDLGPNKPFVPGQPTAYVKMVKVSDVFHYRISRSPDGRSPLYVMSRELNSDATSFKTSLMSPGGEVVIVRVFERVS